MGANDVRVSFLGDTSGLSKSMSQLKGKVFDLKGALMGMAGAVSVGAGAGTLIRFGKHIMTLGDEIDKGSQRIQVSAQTYQELTRAAQIAGTDIGTVEKAFKTMTNVIDDANLGLETAKEMIGRLGLSLDNLKGKSSTERFDMITRALRGVEDAADRAALANDIFGRGGQELQPLINAYSDLAGSAVTMSDEAVRASADFADSITRLTAALEAAGAETGFISYLELLAGNLENIVTLNDKIAKQEGLKTTMRGGVGGFLDDVRQRLADSPRIAAAIGLGSLARGAQGEQLTMEAASLPGGIAKREAAQEKKIKSDQIKAETASKKADAVSAKEAEKIAAIAAKQDAAAANAIANLEEKARLQKMLNDGKEREVKIEEALNAAKKAAGRALTPEEAARISSGAGNLFDLSRGTEAVAGASGRGRAEFSDALLRIGGQVGNAGNAAGLNLDKERNKILAKSAGSLAVIASTQQDGTLP